MKPVPVVIGQQAGSTVQMRENMGQQNKLNDQTSQQGIDEYGQPQFYRKAHKLAVSGFWISLRQATCRVKRDIFSALTTCVVGFKNFGVFFKAHLPVAHQVEAALVEFEIDQFLTGWTRREILLLEVV